MKHWHKESEGVPQLQQQ